MNFAISNKIKNKHSIYFMAYKIVKTLALSGLLTFISYAIVVRNLPKYDYGLYSLVISYSAFFGVFFSGLDESLRRFVSASDKYAGHQIISSVMVIKFILAVLMSLVILALFPYTRDLLDLPKEKYPIFSGIYALSIIAYFLNSIATTASVLITCFLLYGKQFFITAIDGFLYLAVATMVYLLDLNIVQFLILNIVRSLIVILFSYGTLFYTKKISASMLIGGIKYKAIMQDVKKYLFPYSAPLVGVGFSAYFKKYSINYILGIYVGLESLAVYSIFRNMFDFLHKGFSSFIQHLYPLLLSRIEKNKSGFIDKFIRFSWYGLGFRAMVCVVLFFSFDLINKIYKIPIDEFSFLIFIVLLFEHIIFYFSTISNLFIMAAKKTKYILASAMTRDFASVFIVIGMYWLLGIRGIIISILINGAVGVSSTLSFAGRINERFRHFLYGFYIISIIGLISIVIIL